MCAGSTNLGKGKARASPVASPTCGAYWALNPSAPSNRIAGSSLMMEAFLLPHTPMTKGRCRSPFWKPIAQPFAVWIRGQETSLPWQPSTTDLG